MTKHDSHNGFMERVYHHWNHFFFGLFSVLCGVYVLLHQGYLDDPRVTPPPPPPHFERIAFQFADDSWFAFLMIICGLVLLIGVLLESRKCRDWGLIMVAPLYGALFVAFGVRGLLDFCFNLTWVFIGLAVALLIGTAMRGDHRHED